MADDHLASRINAMNLKDRLGDIETDCCNRLNVWLLQMVGASSAPTFVALTRGCRLSQRCCAGEVSVGAIGAHLVVAE
jgi:hypothetical protein